MKYFRQLLRQPLKTLSGMVLMILAVAILCVCIGQALAVQTTTDKLNEQFSTVAIPVGVEGINDFSTSPLVGTEILAWLQQTAQDNPEIVKGITHHGILSAYIPEAAPLNVTATDQYITPYVTIKNLSYYFYQAEPHNMPYSCAMLVITLEEVSEPEIEELTYFVEDRHPSEFENDEAYGEWLTNAEAKSIPRGYTIKLTGTVTDVISLHEGYTNPIGRTARLTFTVPELEQIEELDLIPGEQYVVYGMDYVDEYWKLIGQLNYMGQYDFIQFEPFDSSKLNVLTNQEREIYLARYEATGNAIWKNTYGYFHGIALNKKELEQVNTISMTLGVPISLYEYEAIRENGDGNILEMQKIQDITYTNGNGEMITVSSDEYTERYRIPTIARLEGSVEELFGSPDGALWKEAMTRDTINNHAFAMIGVERLGYLADFALGNTKIVEGRDFTADELSGGSHVCIIHEELALENHLTAGDTVTVNIYSTDFGLPYQEFRTEKKGVLNPTASFYFNTTPFTETATYTIVGICRSERTFPDVAKNEYAFSANTVYVPISSVEIPMETCDSIPFVAAILENGKIEEFHTLAKNAGYAGRFKYCDGDYSTIASNFHNYEKLAQQVLSVGITIYICLLILFLLLYPVSERRTLKTMLSLGSKYSHRFGHVFSLSTAIILPATLLGLLVGTLLWESVVAILQRAAESAMALQIKPGSLAAIAAEQLLLALILSALVSGIIAKPRGMSGRR